MPAKKNNQPFLSITIPETPIPMKRHRISKDLHTYNPQAAIKIAHGWLFKEAMMHAHKNCTDKPLRVEFIFAFKRAKSNKRKFMTARPDIDNVAKMYLDSMATVVYNDDSQVVELSAKKVYSVDPGVNIVVYEL